MKRIRTSLSTVYDFENLYAAYQLARKGKSTKSEVARFDLEVEQELLDLQAQLADESYQPGPYRYYTIYERKPRLISVAPFRDRVVHHAIMRQIEPQLDRTLIHDCYADKPALWQLVADIREYLQTLSLTLHPNKVHLRRTSERVDVLGYLATRDRRWLRNDNGHRATRRLKRLSKGYASNRLSRDDVRASLQSWIGHAMHAETLGLRQQILSGIKFQRAEDQSSSPRAARRLLEQQTAEPAFRES